VFDAAAGLGDFIRGHGGVTDEDHFVVGTVFVRQVLILIIQVITRKLLPTHLSEKPSIVIRSVFFTCRRYATEDQ
jgi:hypothetical protein